MEVRFDWAAAAAGFAFVVMNFLMLGVATLALTVGLWALVRPRARMDEWRVA